MKGEAVRHSGHRDQGVESPRGHLSDRIGAATMLQ
jgi:hypothetical protein